MLVRRSGLAVLAPWLQHHRSSDAGSSQNSGGAHGWATLDHSDTLAPFANGSGVIDSIGFGFGFGFERVVFVAVGSLDLRRGRVSLLRFPAAAPPEWLFWDEATSTLVFYRIGRPCALRLFLLPVLYDKSALVKFAALAYYVATGASSRSVT